MLGRGSRTRGICEGILFKISNFKETVLIDMMKK
jgi:hypothetical protein